MDEKQQYFELWQTAVAKAAEALKAGNMEEAEKYHQDMEDAYERYKEAADFEDSTLDSKFATLNTTLESVMPKLMAKNKKALRECINLIKEDKNLMAQFKFCNALKKFNCDTDAKDYINESLNLVSKNINIKTLKESNQKLAKLLVKYSIKPSNDINESDLKFAKNCDYLLSHKKTLNNLTEFTNNLKEASDYIVENRKNNKERVDILSMAEQVEKKLNSLNEAEQELVKDIMVAKTGVAESRRQNLFNKIKNECIDKINKMIDENTGSEKERLLNLKETILLKEYDKNNVVGDIAKLLEVGAVLSDKEHDKYL
jgi:hypothetical protein